MEFVEEDEILQDIYIREFLSVEKMLEFDPKFVQSSYDEIVELIAELLKNNTRARVFADLHKSIVNPLDKILAEYVLCKVDVARKTNEDDSYIDTYKQAQSAANYNLQQSQKAFAATPFDLTNANDSPNPVIDIPASLLLPEPHDTVQLTDSDCINNTRIPVEEIAWQPITVTNESYLVANDKHIKSSKFISWDASSDPKTLYEWIETKLEPSFKTTLENHLSKLVTNYKSKQLTDDYICDIHTIDSKLMHDGRSLHELHEDDFNALVSTLETLNNTFNEVIKDKDIHTKNSASIYKFNSLAKYIVFWEFLGTFKFPFISDERIIQLREQCGNYTMEHNKYSINDESLRKNIPYNMLVNIVNKTRSLDELLEYIETYRHIITYNRIKNLLDDLSKTTIEQIDTPTSYNDVLDFVKKFKLTVQSIHPEKTRPFLNTYQEIAEVVEGNDTTLYDGTPFIASQGTYDADFEMGMLDDIMLALDPNKGTENTIETGEEDAYTLIISKYSEKYNALLESNAGTSEVLATVLKQLIRIRDATGMKWNETHINEWIKNINNNDIVKLRMSRVEQIKSKIHDISDIVANQICAPTEKLANARIKQIGNSELVSKLESVYPAIHKEWTNACETILISGLASFWLDSLEASVKGYLGFNILNGMIIFVNTWSPYGVPLEKENKIGKRGILYYIDAVTSYILKNNTSYAEDIMTYVANHYYERLKEIKTYWKTNTSKLVQSRAEQAVVSLVELFNDLKAKKQISRNTIINTFIKGFVYLPIQFPIEDWNKYKKLPAWDLGCCTAKITDNYSADNDIKTYTKEIYTLKIQLARQRWNIEPRKKYQLFRKVDETHTTHTTRKDKKHEKTKDSGKKYACTTYYTQPEVHETITTPPNASQFDFIFQNTWFPQTYVSNILQDPKSCNLYAQNIISKFIHSQKAIDINSVINNIKDIGSIINIFVLFIKNIFAISIKHKNDSNMIAYNIYNDALHTLQEMKSLLITIQNTFKGNTYTQVLYYSKYILALAFCLPGQVIYIDTQTDIYIPDGIDIDDVISTNYKLMVSWKNTYKMPTITEFNDYINKMREESKIKTMASYNVLSDDDLQLMKDTKRFGLKVDQTPENTNPNESNNTHLQDDVQDNEGIRDFYPDDPDKDPNEEML